MSFQSFELPPSTWRGNVLWWKRHHAGPSASVSFHFSDIRMEIKLKIVNLKKQLPTIADLFIDSYIYNHSFSLRTGWQRVVARRGNSTAAKSSFVTIKTLVNVCRWRAWCSDSRTSWIIQTQLIKSFTDTDLGFFSSWSTGRKVAEFWDLLQTLGSYQF